MESELYHAIIILDDLSCSVLWAGEDTNTLLNKSPLQ